MLLLYISHFCHCCTKLRKSLGITMSFNHSCNDCPSSLSADSNWRLIAVCMSLFATITDLATFKACCVSCLTSSSTCLERTPPAVQPSHCFYQSLQSSAVYSIAYGITDIMPFEPSMTLCIVLCQVQVFNMFQWTHSLSTISLDHEFLFGITHDCQKQMLNLQD